MLYTYYIIHIVLLQVFNPQWFRHSVDLDSYSEHWRPLLLSPSNFWSFLDWQHYENYDSDKFVCMCV